MESIGLTLQQARQKRRLKLETISKKTKISIRYLKALEAEDWDVFPASAYVQAFLRSYANSLNLDSDELVREYKKYLEPTTKVPVAERLIPKGMRTKKMTILPLAVSIVVLIIWGGWFLFFRSIPSPVIEVIEEKKAPLILSAIAIEEVWVNIAIDEKEKVQELLQAGDSRTWEAEEGLEIKVGNAGGISLELNGEPLEPLGERGQVATRTFVRKETGKWESEQVGK
jgi:transcriptional regulator with XRE-family HTH domain